MRCTYQQENNLPGQVITVVSALSPANFQPAQPYTLTKIKIATINNYAFNLSKDHLYSLGAEGNVFFPPIRSSIGLRWLREFGASNRFQGNTVFITLAPYIKFFAPRKE